MDVNPLPALAISFLVATAGCSASFLGISEGQVVEYEAQRAELDAERSLIYRAMLAYVLDNQLDLVYDDPNLGRIEAVSKAETGYGMVTREKWVLQIEPGALTFESQLEERSLGGVWRSPDRVNTRYSYTQEKVALEEIKSRLLKAEMRAMSEQSRHTADSEL